MNHAKILIAEDDADINNLLCRLLKEAGYHPVQAFSGTEAKMLLEIEKPDAVLLDLMLPGMDGEALILYIREENQLNIPILVISAKVSLANKLETMTAGADDYITKPFEAEEVLVRLLAALRRYKRAPQEEEAPTFCHRGLCLNMEARSVTLSGAEIPLTNYEFEILYLLIKQPGKVYSRESLYEQVWKNGYYGEDNTVNVHVSNIRKKIAEAGAQGEYIKTVWGIGFMLN